MLDSPALRGEREPSKVTHRTAKEEVDIMGLSLKSDKAKTGSAPESPDRHARQEQGPRRYRARINREPVLDRIRVQELAGGVHSQSRLLEFLNLFLVLLPSRVNNVVSALNSGDHEAASAAAQSLASSAAMAGAARLELVAWLVDADLRVGRMDRARETGRRLGPDASELASALSRLLTGS